MTGKYEELKQRQTSGVMSWLSNQPFDAKLGLAWGAVAAGIVGGGMSFTGTMDAKVQFCLQVNETKLCKTSYRMPLYEWEKNRPSHAVLSKTIPATNPCKPLWAGLSALGFSAAGAIFRQLQDDERQLQELININEKKEVAIAQIAANAEIESHTVDQVTVIQQAELLADTEVKQLAIEQEEELFRFKTAGMSEEEIADFVRSVEPPYLTGMSLDQVNDPSDKVQGHPSPALNGQLPDFDRDRIINESKGLMIIGDMGAAKTCVAQYIANGFDGYGIIVFDPHGMTDWGNAYVITKMGVIYEQMRILLDLLENGDTTPLLIICDEWLEIRGDRRNKKGSEYAGLADDFIRLFSTKPRKFNKLAAFVLHSPNVEAAGVDSFLRENYLKIYLGRLAKKVFSDITDCAYPCVLEDAQQEHPTHGHHTEFKPKGKAPRNLQPLNSAPITIPLAYLDGDEVKVNKQGWSNGWFNGQQSDIRHKLEFLIDTRGDEKSKSEKTPLTEPQAKLIEYAKEKANDWLAPSWFTNNKEYFKPWKADQVIELFSQLEALGYGQTISSNGTVKFRLNDQTP